MNHDRISKAVETYLQTKKKSEEMKIKREKLQCRLGEFEILEQKQSEDLESNRVLEKNTFDQFACGEVDKDAYQSARKRSENSETCLNETRSIITSIKDQLESPQGPDHMSIADAKESYYRIVLEELKINIETTELPNLWRAYAVLDLMGGLSAGSAWADFIGFMSRWNWVPPGREDLHKLLREIDKPLGIEHDFDQRSVTVDVGQAQAFSDQKRDDEDLPEDNSETFVAGLSRG